MSPVQQIAIVDLLRQREAAFVKVWECETAVERLLGCPYPFAPPPALPSRQPRPGPREPGKAEKTAALRRLDLPEENAYRVRYVYQSQAGVSYQTTVDVVRALLGLQTVGFRIDAVDTVRLGPDGEAEFVAPLWQRSESGNAPLPGGLRRASRQPGAGSKDEGDAT
jgi:hypothetical protein